MSGGGDAAWGAGDTIMQFQLATDYAIRILMCLHEHGNKLLSAVYMAEQLGITYLYFMKVISKLKQAGIVTSMQGCNGGYRLARPAGEITMLEVVDIMEEGIHINRCLQTDGFCSREAGPDCRLKQKHIALQNVITNYLRDVVITDI